MMDFLPLILVAVALGVGAWFVWGRKKDDDPAPPIPITPNNPWTIGPIIGGVNYSKNMPLQPARDEAGWLYFDFPQSDGVHYVTRPATEPGRSSVALRFAIDGTATGFKEVDAAAAGPGMVRLFIQRRGDDWSGAGARVSYRFWSAPLTLMMGEMTLRAGFTSDQWTNVSGQQDPDGFQAALLDLESVGFTFGGMFAGHGAYAEGQARFYIREFTVS